MKTSNEYAEEFKQKEAELIDLMQANDQTEESKQKQHDLVSELMDLEQMKDFAN